MVGGGLRQSRIGELAIGRTAVLLKADGHRSRLKPIRHHSDHAGLIGCIQLVPSWILAGHDSILAVDIGGSNIRAGIVELRRKKSAGLSTRRRSATSSCGAIARMSPSARTPCSG